MYGGHITDDWDRRLCRTYLEEYMSPEQVIIILHQNICRIISSQFCKALIENCLVSSFFVMGYKLRQRRGRGIALVVMIVIHLL